ncbi:glycerate kinase [Neisseria leonii]|uniref:glycerate kinase n=1 Tax=Neisseria leonii TaxID=2995413 RepID=UPI00237A0F77|nr:glycerate kinase [Neisseria sp. 3986]MDD9325223.1 glycerate kinase [Neisseria sp. 3986]
MKVVIAPDSFKESLSADQVARAVERGWRKVFPDADYVRIPMADGGEGTVESLCDALGGRLETVEVTSPTGGRHRAQFAVSGDGETAVLEMAAASGLHLVPPSERNPLTASSYGTGELIRAALDLGVKRIILGIGGSATNDAGAGMLCALGARLTDEAGRPLAAGGAALARLARLDLSGLDRRLHDVDIQTACDVDNPLCGANGASAVFGPQKGADAAMVAQLDAALRRFADVARHDCGTDMADVAGAGAAGGMGGGLLLLPQVRLRPGVEIVAEAVGLAEKVAAADWVITGEGRMDGQSIRGKTPVGVAKTAKRFGKPVIALVGGVGRDYAAVYGYGIDAVVPVLQRIDSRENILAAAAQNIEAAAENTARLLKTAMAAGKAV